MIFKCPLCSYRRRCDDVLLDNEVASHLCTTHWNQIWQVPRSHSPDTANRCACCSKIMPGKSKYKYWTSHWYDHFRKLLEADQKRFLVTLALTQGV